MRVARRPSRFTAASESPPPTTDAGGRVGDRARHRLGARREGVDLEDAHRAVPEDRLRARAPRRRSALRRLGADVERPSSRRGSRVDDLRVGARVERLRDDVVDRQQQLVTAARRGGEDPARVVACAPARRARRRRAARARAGTCTPSRRRRRARRRGARAPRAPRACRRPWRRRAGTGTGAPGSQHDGAGARAPRAAGRRPRRAATCGDHAGRRRVRAVRGAEGVVHVDVGERRERAREARVVLLLARRGSAGSRAAAPRRRRSFATAASASRADAVRRERDRLARAARASRAATGAQRVASASALPFGRPRCEASTTRAPAASSSASVGSEARMRVSSATWPSFERDVQVGAHEHALARARRRATQVVESSATGIGELAAHQQRRDRRRGSSSPTRCRTRTSTFAKLPPITLVLCASKIDECGLPRKSIETSGSSQTCRMPFSGPAAALRIASLIASAVASRVRLDREVDHRDVRGRHAHRVAVELALELGQHQADRLRGAGRWSGSSTPPRRARGAGPCAGSRA